MVAAEAIVPELRPPEERPEADLGRPEAGLLRPDVGRDRDVDERRSAMALCKYVCYGEVSGVRWAVSGERDA